jgi:hypothetical protein
MGMIKIEQAGVGTVESGDKPIYDSTGTGMLPLQVEVTGAATYRILGRLAADAPWVELRAADTAGCLESFTWVPFMALDVTAGAGTVTLWIGEK